MSSHSVSLLIPCYNSERSLPFLLEDARNQTQPFSEIIMFDDGSTDNTVAIAKDYGCEVILGSANKGVGWARQQLLEAASTDYIHFHDSDDRIAPNFLEVLLPYCQPDRAVCCALREQLKDGKEVIRRYQAFNEGIDPIRFLIKNFVHLNTVIYPRQFVLRAGKFRSELRTNEDRVFHYYLAAANLKFLFVDQPLASQIRNSNSTMSKAKFADVIKNFIYGAEIAIELFPKNYYPVIAEYLLFYADKSIFQGELELAQAAIRLAEKCGTTQITTQGRTTHLLSRFLGIERTLLLRRQYAGLRQKFHVGS